MKYFLFILEVYIANNTTTVTVETPPLQEEDNLALGKDSL